MSVSERKVQERAAREELILGHARGFLLRRGFQDWNMEQLAGSVNYAKGTLYLHFESKEDLCLAVATRALRERADLFERASRFTGRTRERIRAIGFACCEFAYNYPEYFHIEMMLKSASFWEKASEERRQAHAFQGARTWRVVNHIVVQAMALGDLPSGRFTPEQATFALVSVTVGSHIMTQEPILRVQAGITDPMASVRTNQDLICDGLGWQPLLHDYDYASTDKNICLLIKSPKNYRVLISRFIVYPSRFIIKKHPNRKL
jgi:AcrR family transcriptional regulator